LDRAAGHPSVAALGCGAGEPPYPKYAGDGRPGRPVDGGKQIRSDEIAIARVIGDVWLSSLVAW
jgi:hypothetical protein